MDKRVAGMAIAGVIPMEMPVRKKEQSRTLTSMLEVCAAMM
jgi:hypothetical protein